MIHFYSALKAFGVYLVATFVFLGFSTNVYKDGDDELDLEEEDENEQNLITRTVMETLPEEIEEQQEREPEIPQLPDTPPRENNPMQSIKLPKDLPELPKTPKYTKSRKDIPSSAPRVQSTLVV